MSSTQKLTIRIGTRLEEVEKLVIMRTLQFAEGDKSVAAKILGISLKTLKRKLDGYLSYRICPSDSIEN